MKLKFFPGAAKAIPKSSTQLNEVKAHFENQTTHSIVLNDKKFVRPLEISREIFDLNNTTFNSSSQTFEYKPGKDDEDQGEAGQPKKFQKKYLEITKQNAQDIFGLRRRNEATMTSLMNLKTAVEDN